MEIKMCYIEDMTLGEYLEWVTGVPYTGFNKDTSGFLCITDGNKDSWINSSSLLHRAIRILN